MLENHIHGPLVGGKAGYVLALQKHSTFAGRDEPRDCPQRRRLAAPRGSQKSEEFTFGDLEIDVGKHLIVAEAVGDVLQDEKGRRGHTMSSVWASASSLRLRWSRRE